MTQFAHNAAWPDEMHAAVWMARAEARALHQEMTGEDLVITSGHRPGDEGSLHAEYRAFDIRVWHFDDHAHIRAFAAELHRRLGPDFDVVVEGPAATDLRYRNKPPHVHVEYDPKGPHVEVADQ